MAKYYIIAELGNISIRQEVGCWSSTNKVVEASSYEEASQILETMRSEEWYVSTTYGTTWMQPVSQMRDDYSYGRLYTGTYESVYREYKRRRDEE